MLTKILCRAMGHKWEWVLDEKATSWIRCSRCKKSMFGEEIGVILINWKKTNDDYNLTDALLWNIYNKGIVEKFDYGKRATYVKSHL